MGRVIAIANQKGGVGKTTTAVNLSACMAAQNKRTLLMDIDPQGNSTSGLGIDKNEITASVYDAIINDTPMKDIIIQSNYENLYVCPANVDLAGAEIEMVAVADREFLLKSAIAEIKQEYDYIFIDCPPSLGLLTLNAFTAVDSVLVPIQCEYYALEGLSQLTKTIRIVKGSLNPSIELEGVLLTMFDARTNLSIQVADEVKRFFPNKVFQTVIPRNVRLSEAPSFGEPIIVYDKYSKGAEGYTELAKEMIAG